MFEIRSPNNDGTREFEDASDCAEFISTEMDVDAVRLLRDFFENNWDYKDLLDWLAEGWFEGCSTKDILAEALENIKWMYEEGVYSQDMWYLGFIRYTFKEE